MPFSRSVMTSACYRCRISKETKSEIQLSRTVNQETWILLEGQGPFFAQIGRMFAESIIRDTLLSGAGGTRWGAILQTTGFRPVCTRTLRAGLASAYGPGEFALSSNSL